MAAGLILGFVIAQMAFGLLFLIWLWILRARVSKRTALDPREALLWLAVVSFTLGVVVDFYFMLAHSSMGPRAKLPAVSFSLGCVGVILALLGRGKGRILTAMASCGLALSWLPFILP
jgi:protein-S-isoprenylcysteine O-methyltransferase Ste14